MNTTKYGSLNGLRTIACIGIVLMHILTNINYKVGNNVFNIFIKSFNSFVYLFMIISAFGMCCGYYNKLKNNEITLEEFYKRRLHKVLPFFTFLLIIDVIYEHTISSLIEAVSNFTLMFGFIQKEIKVLGVAWFIGLVFIFYFMFPYFVYLFFNKKRAWITTLVAIFMNIISVYYFNLNRANMFYSFVYFCIGGLIYLYKDDIIKYFSKRKLLSVLLIILFIFLYYSLSIMNVPLLVRVTPLSTLLIIYAIVFDSKVLNNRFTKISGDLSMNIYLCHMLIFRVIQKLHLIHIFKNGYLSYCTLAIIVLIGSFFFSIGFQKILNKIEGVYLK